MGGGETDTETEGGGGGRGEGRRERDRDRDRQTDRQTESDRQICERSVHFNLIQFSLKKTLIIPQGAILLWSWRVRKSFQTFLNT